MTCTPSGSSSILSTLVTDSRPDLDALYAADRGRSTYEETLQTFTMSPDPCQTATWSN
jgi:hypothetical protein